MCWVHSFLVYIYFSTLNHKCNSLVFLLFSLLLFSSFLFSSPLLSSPFFSLGTALSHFFSFFIPFLSLSFIFFPHLFSQYPFLPYWLQNLFWFSFLILEVRASAQKRPDCLDSPFGCCWDLTDAQGPNGEGCRGKSRLRPFFNSPEFHLFNSGSKNVFLYNNFLNFFFFNVRF